MKWGPTSWAPKHTFLSIFLLWKKPQVGHRWQNEGWQGCTGETNIRKLESSLTCNNIYKMSASVWTHRLTLPINPGHTHTRLPTEADTTPVWEGGEAPSMWPFIINETNVSWISPVVMSSLMRSPLCVYIQWLRALHNVITNPQHPPHTFINGPHLH